MPAALPIGAAVASLAVYTVAMLRPGRNLLTLGLAVTAVFAAAWAASLGLDAARGGSGGLSALLDQARWLAFYGLLLALLSRAAPRTRRLVACFAGIGAASLGLGAALLAAPLLGGEPPPAWSAAAGLAQALAMLLLAENVFRSATAQRRWHVNLVCIALAALYGYDTVLYSDGLLFHRLSPGLLHGRLVMSLAAAPLLLLAVLRGRRWDARVAMSHDAAFHSATLLASGLLLFAFAAAGEVMRQTGADWTEVASVALPCIAAVALAVCLTSGTLRSGLRAVVVRHFLARRYDYRREWLRCMDTLAGPDTRGRFDLRVIQVLADTVDSPAGCLMLRDKDGDAFRWAGSWNCPPVHTTLLPSDPVVAWLCGGEPVQLGARPAAAIGAELRPFRLATPLVHGGRLIGFVLLAPPRAPFRIDWEVLELLQTIGAEVAVMITEMRLRDALEQGRALGEFGKRFAFLAHDIRTVSSQLAMLLDNANRSTDPAEFGEAMRETVFHCRERMAQLLSRLKDADGSAPPDRKPVTPGAGGVLRRLAAAASLSHGHPVAFDGDDEGAALAIDPHDFETVVTHLIGNAVDATLSAAPVRIACTVRDCFLQIDITDQGPGMTPEVVRDDLFRPFASTKGAGMGLGGFQARDLARKAGGNLIVLSRPGLGTTMRLLLPMATGLAPSATGYDR